MIMGPQVIGGPAVSPEWAPAIELFARSLRAVGTPRTTLRLRCYQVGRLAAAMAPAGPWDVLAEQIEAWLGEREWAPATLASYRAGVRVFYAWAVRTRRIAASPAADLPAVRLRPAVPRPAPEIAYREALARSDERVRLMVRLAAELGMRRAEVAVAHSDDVERDMSGWTLRVHGKGEKVRRVPMPVGLAATLRALPPGWVFPGQVDGHVSPDWVGKLVARALPGAWTMHTLRHRFGTTAYSYQRDLAVVQELMGHSTPTTTRIYVAVPSSAMRATVEAVSRL